MVRYFVLAASRRRSHNFVVPHDGRLVVTKDVGIVRRVSNAGLISPLAPTPESRATKSKDSASVQKIITAPILVTPLPTLSEHRPLCRPEKKVDEVSGCSSSLPAGLWVSIPLDRLQWYFGKPEVVPDLTSTPQVPEIPVLHLPEEDGTQRPTVTKLRHANCLWKRRFGNIELLMTKEEADRLGLR